MPTLKNAEIVSFDPNNLPPVTRAIRVLLGERVSTDTGLKIRRIIRELDKLAGDAVEERARLIGLYAVKDEDGKPTVADGNYILSDPLGFSADIVALMNAEVEVTEFLVPKDMVRKIRDETGKVYETDDMDVEVILWLGNLLQEPAKPDIEPATKAA